jgi:hypothetical protein
MMQLDPQSRWQSWMRMLALEASESPGDYREFRRLAHPSPASPRAVRIWGRVLRRIVSLARRAHAHFRRGLGRHDDRRHRLGQVG